MKKDINDKDDVRLMVDEFYARVQKDELLSPVFSDTIGNHWSQHLQKMYDFWETILFCARLYTGSPFMKHAPLHLSADHFERWLVHFNETIDQFFEGEKAEEAKWRAGKMADLFTSKMDHISKNPDRSPLK
jgi:hemoglobin